MRDTELSRDGFEGASNIRLSERELARIILDMAAFSLDVAGATRSFSVKLEEQQGWTRQYTLRAIEEYKRFMVLAAVSPTEVTPSRTVDQVWHLHLQYSKSYRDEMCAGVLGKQIDHNPERMFTTRGNTSERCNFTRGFLVKLHHATYGTFRSSMKRR
jgi:hypothetical protein